MTDVSTSLLSLLTRGVAAAAAMLQMDRIYQRHANTRLDGEMELEFVAYKAKFEAFARVLSRLTMSASAADMEMALRHASFSPFSDHKAWTALIEKLSTSRASNDQAMAKALQVFA